LNIALIRWLSEIANSLPRFAREEIFFENYFKNFSVTFCNRRRRYKKKI